MLSLASVLSVPPSATPLTSVLSITPSDRLTSRVTQIAVTAPAEVTDSSAYAQEDSAYYTGSTSAAGDAVVNYAYVKYKPSDAGIPEPPSVYPKSLVSLTPPEPQTPAPQEQAATPPAPAGAGDAAATTDTAAFSGSVGISATDYHAYSSTQIRNQSNLTAAAPQLNLAG